MSLPAKFDQYEIFRILIPGYYFITVMIIWFLIIPILDKATLNFINSGFFGFLYIFFGIFIGLLVYAYDYPSKISGFNAVTEYNQLKDYCYDLFCKDCTSKCNNFMENSDDAESTYFFIQYNIMDIKSQDVIQYFRSIYRVFTNIIFISRIFYRFEATILLLITLYYIIFALQNINDFFYYIKYGITFIFILYGVEYIISKYKKGENYLKKSIQFQKTYIKLNKENIEQKLCKNKH